MTRLDPTPCWVILAPLPAAQLDELVREHWHTQVPHAIDPPPWFVVPVGPYGAVISPEPGTEGPDRALAAQFSLLTVAPVYSLLLDPERERICEWEGGDLVSETDRDPRPLSASWGLEIPQSTALTVPASVAVVEGASVPEIRQVLTDHGVADWIRLTANRRGVLVTAESGPLGTQAWDIAEALPAAKVYYVQRHPTTGAFSVLVLHGSEEAGWFRTPPLDDDTPGLTQILGASTPEAILDALDIPPEAR